MINLRLLWHDARKVISEINEQKAGKKQKTSALDKMDFLWKNLFVFDAEAAERKKRRTDIVEERTTSVGNKTACLVAGYVTTYSTSVCDRKKIDEAYLKLEDVAKANTYCGTDKLACNPIVFGTPNGKAICLDPKERDSFQIATHYKGPCETLIGTNHNGGGNHLGKEVKFLTNKKLHEGRYEEGNLDIKGIDAIRDEVRTELNGDYKASEDFLYGLLKSRNNDSRAELFKSGIIDDATLEMIRGIKNQFEDDIGIAVASCKASSNAKTHKDQNFWEACDQLQRRFLFVKEYLQTKCPKPSTIKGDTFKCACGTGPTAPLVNPGVKECPVAQAVVAPPPPPIAVTPPTPTPVTPTKPPVCGPGETLQTTIGDAESASAGQTQQTCVRNPTAPAGQASGSGVWDFMKKLLPFAIGGVALFAMYKLFSPKKPTLNPAGDLCPNGLKPPCGQMCPVPLAMQSSGSCGCAACPPGQSIADSSTSSTSNPCTCTSSAPANTLITCADNVTKVSDRANCPAPTYTCWNGTTVKNPLNCPEKPTTPQPGGTTH